MRLRLIKKLNADAFLDLILIILRLILATILVLKHLINRHLCQHTTTRCTQDITLLNKVWLNHIL